MYLCKFIGVGRVSDPALSMKDNWPDGKPSMILFQRWFSASSSVTFKNLFCTQRVESFWFQRLVEFSFMSFLVSFLRAASDTGALDREVCRQLDASVGISCLFRKAGLSIRWFSSMRPRLMTYN